MNPVKNDNKYSEDSYKKHCMQLEEITNKSNHTVQWWL